MQDQVKHQGKLEQGIHLKGIIQFGSNLETDNNEETELRGLLQIISHEVCTILASSNADRAKIACHKAIMLFNAFPSSWQIKSDVGSFSIVIDLYFASLFFFNLCRKT